MKVSQFLFKIFYLRALGELAGGEDILKSAGFLIVQERSGMWNNLSFFHQLVTQVFLDLSCGSGFLAAILGQLYLAKRQSSAEPA